MHYIITSYHPLIFLRTKIPPMKPPIIGVTVNAIGVQEIFILDMIEASNYLNEPNSSITHSSIVVLII